MSEISTDEAKRAQLISDVDTLCKKYELGFDDFLDALAYEMLQQAEKEQHEAVKSCLLSVCGSLRQAAMDFYVSTK
jgi:hypothetical protein